MSTLAARRYTVSGALVLLGVLSAGACSGLAQVRVNPDAKALADFMDRVKEYVALHQKLEATLPKLPKDATSEQLEQSQRSLARLIEQARPGARQGDLFVKEARAVLRRQLLRAFRGPDGADLKGAIMEDNAGPIKISVNGRYPDIPLTTVPSKVLQALPELPSELEYRFVGHRLILFDEHAHLIADIMDDAVPR